MKIKKFKLLMLTSVFLGLGLVNAVSAESSSNCTTVCSAGFETGQTNNTEGADNGYATTETKDAANDAANQTNRTDEGADNATNAADEKYGCNCTDKFSS